MILVLAPLFIFRVQAQDEKGDDIGFFDKIKIKLKMRKARNQLEEDNQRGAMNTAREVTAMDEDHPGAHFLIARAHYQRKHYDLAYDYLRDASHGKEKIGDRYFLFSGRVYHRKMKLDTAIRMFKTYKKRLKGKTIPKERRLKAQNIDHYIQQCKFAQKAMKDSVDVDIKNMGRRINSRYGEYTPCVAKGGKKLFFTARRSDTKGGGIDYKGDHRYFEDIYYSEWDKEKEQWSRPTSVPGRINTEGYDGITSLSPNGKRMYIYRNNPEQTGDILRSELSDRTGKWRRPKLLPEPINSSYYEASISTTKKEEKAFFVSERKGGEGRGDIYVSEKKGYNKWTEPKNLGPTVNTSRDEEFVHVRPDGKTIIFSSNGHKGLGSYDVFISRKVDGEWTEPENLGYPINTVNEETTFSLLPGKKVMYMAAIFDENFGGRDIYRIDLKDMQLFQKEKGK
ncbi:MAG: hypothetical protein ABEH38_05245 [Flavobacteriales bacterium]